ncbi:MAG: hypothetical protein U9Q27_00155 [Patescibacteria group bacterium]|nr:hypothetical protein [Patescibacteria group bacterium]
MFNITVGDKTKKSMKLLNIESFPFTESEIKSKFRKKIKSCHSDKVKGDDFLARKIIEAYSHIKHLAIGDNEIAKKGKGILKAEQENEDMFDFFDTCKQCNGKGKIIQHHEADTELCNVCMSHSSFFSVRNCPTGKIKESCRACKGMGKFKQRSGRIVTCYRCKGKGWIIKKCPKCKGKGLVHVKAHTTENICLICGGTGRIKLNPFNPVIPKGAVL